MKKILLVFVAMTFIAFGFTPGAFAAGMDKSTGMDKSDKAISSDARDL